MEPFWQFARKSNPLCTPVLPRSFPDTVDAVACAAEKQAVAPYAVEVQASMVEAAELYQTEEAWEVAVSCQLELVEQPNDQLNWSQSGWST